MYEALLYRHSWSPTGQRQSCAHEGGNGWTNLESRQKYVCSIKKSTVDRRARFDNGCIDQYIWALRGKISAVPLIARTDFLNQHVLHAQRIASKMKDVYSVCWDSHFDDTDLVLESREKLLPDIQRLCREQESVADKLDIERHKIQFDAAVATNHQDGLKEAGDSDVAEDDEGKCNGDGQQNSDAEEGVPGEVSNSSKVAVAAAGKDDGVISRNERDDDDRSHNSPSHKYNQNDDGNEKDGNVKTSNDDDDHNHRHSDLNHRQSGRIDIESLLRDEDGVESNDDDDGDEDGDRKHNNPSHLYTHNDDDTNENENSVKVKANDGDGDDDDHSHNRNVEDDDCDEDTADDCGLVPMHVTS